MTKVISKFNGAVVKAEHEEKFGCRRPHKKSRYPQKMAKHPGKVTVSVRGVKEYGGNLSEILSIMNALSSYCRSKGVTLLKKKFVRGKKKKQVHYSRIRLEFSYDLKKIVALENLAIIIRDFVNSKGGYFAQPMVFHKINDCSQRFSVLKFYIPKLTPVKVIKEKTSLLAPTTVYKFIKFRVVFNPETTLKAFVKDTVSNEISTVENE